MRFTDEVTEQDCSKEGRDIAAEVQVQGGHLPFHLLLQRCQQACFRFLYALSGFDAGLSTPHVAAELHRGIGVGFIDVDVTVVSIGRTSFTLRCEVFQSEMRAAVARIVLVNFDYKREEAVPLSSSQRAALEPHLVGQPRPPTVGLRQGGRPSDRGASWQKSIRRRRGTRAPS